MLLPTNFLTHSKQQKTMHSLQNSPSTALAASYAAFWHWFAQHERAFFQAVEDFHSSNDQSCIEKHFFAPLSSALDTIKKDLGFLTGMLDDTTVELVVSAEGAIEKIAFVEELIQAAPVLVGWKFTALKTGMDKHTIMEMGGYKFTTDTISFYANEDAAHPDKIDLTVVHRDLTKNNHRVIQHGTLLFLENYLGELAFATLIDQTTVIRKHKAQQKLNAIEELNDYLLRRQQAFIEKYNGRRHSTNEDSYAAFKVALAKGHRSLAVMNTALLAWDEKVSHPWILVVGVQFDGILRNGMHNLKTYELLRQLEGDIRAELSDDEGYLNIGRQLGDGSCKVYYACHDFRKPSKVLHQLQVRYTDMLDVTYEIYKDKYWQSFEQYSRH